VYFYVMESPTSPRIRRLEEQILTTIRGYGISGEVVLANPARPARELARAGLSKGYATIVAIGGDRVINDVAAAVQGTRASMGIIPIDAHPRIPQLIGSLDPLIACEALRRQEVVYTDIAFIDPGYYFLTDIQVEQANEFPIRAHIDDVIVETTITRLTLNGDGHLELLNDRQGRSLISQFATRFTGKPAPAPNISSFQGQYIKIETSRAFSVTSGGRTVAKTPFVAAVKPNALKLIVKRGTVRSTNSPDGE